MMIVSDTSNDRVQVFNSEGEFMCKFGSLGKGKGQFNGVMKKIAINHENGDLFIPDYFNHRIQIFEASQIGGHNESKTRKNQCLVM